MEEEEDKRMVNGLEKRVRLGGEKEFTRELKKKERRKEKDRKNERLGGTDGKEVGAAGMQGQECSKHSSENTGQRTASRVA